MADNDTRMESDRKDAIVFDVMNQFSQMMTARNPVASQWEEVAELILPTSRNTFFYGNYNTPGQKKTDRQVDASGMMALTRFGAICDSLLTPRDQKWHGLRADDDYVMKQRNVALWFEKATRKLFDYRYAPQANFVAQNQQNYQSLGAFGTMGMFTDEFDPMGSGLRGIRYKAIPLGELHIIENHQGLVVGVIRWYRMKAYQIKQKWPDTYPPTIQPALDQHSEADFDILHRVMLRDDYDPQAILTPRGKRFKSEHVCMQGKCLLQEGGYYDFPFAISRYDQAPGEVYGRSVAMMVLPALKTLNAQKRTFLKQGHRAADPVLLTNDDGLMDLSMKPGAKNPGFVTSDGKSLVHTLPTGDIKTNEKMMDMERQLINDAFLVTLFQILTETPTMTATEVIERTNEKGILLAPTVGRQQSEYLGNMIPRELNLLVSQRLIEPMPPELREAQGAYTIVYTSPLSRAMHAQEAAGFIRTMQTAQELIAITQDPSILDAFNMDKALAGIAEIQGVLPSWMASPDEIVAKKQARAKQAAINQKIQAAPAQAAMMKAAKMPDQSGQQGSQPNAGVTG